MSVEYQRNTNAVVVLRILVGVFFLFFGEYKVFGAGFTMRGEFEQWIRSFLIQGAYPWMKPVLQHVILPHARFSPS